MSCVFRISWPGRLEPFITCKSALLEMGVLQGGQAKAAASASTSTSSAHTPIE